MDTIDVPGMKKSLSAMMPAAGKPIPYVSQFLAPWCEEF
jgi:hypothetical protein